MCLELSKKLKIHEERTEHKESEVQKDETQGHLLGKWVFQDTNERRHKVSFEWKLSSFLKELHSA